VPRLKRPLGSAESGPRLLGNESTNFFKNTVSFARFPKQAQPSPEVVSTHPIMEKRNYLLFIEDPTDKFDENQEFEEEEGEEGYGDLSILAFCTPGRRCVLASDLNSIMYNVLVVIYRTLEYYIKAVCAPLLPRTSNNSICSCFLKRRHNPAVQFLL
jgi:hypothetical protein